jgi:hypothetical protein
MGVRRRSGEAGEHVGREDSHDSDARAVVGNVNLLGELIESGNAFGSELAPNAGVRKKRPARSA